MVWYGYLRYPLDDINECVMKKGLKTRYVQQWCVSVASLVQAYSGVEGGCWCWGGVLHGAVGGCNGSRHHLLYTNSPLTQPPIGNHG